MGASALGDGAIGTLHDVSGYYQVPLINLCASELALLAGRRRRATGLQHVLQHAILEPRDRLVLDGGEVEHAAEVGQMAAERVPAQVGAVLPLGGVGRAGAGVAQVAVLDLAVEVKPLVHLILLSSSKITARKGRCCSPPRPCSKSWRSTNPGPDLSL